MLNQLTHIDILVLILMLLIMPVCGIVVAMRKKNTEDYFLAGRSIRWWTVAGSIFGTNISSFHLIGMLGVGYSIGFVQSHYEIVFPAVLLICYVFLASYRQLNLFTLSQYLEIRFSNAARLSYTILLVLIILVQLVGAFYVGSITLQWLFGGTSFAMSYPTGLVFIGLITCSYTIWGGMESIVITDNIQTLMMLAAGFSVAFFTFSQPEIGGFGGLMALDAAAPVGQQKLHLYLPPNHPNLPWTGVFTGLLLQHCFNFSTNQFLVQRALSASSDEDARKGIIVSGMLKLLIPFFSIATGIAAFYLFKARFGAIDFNSDNTFLKLVETVIPSGTGLSGMILAGLTAATFSSVDSMMNAATTLLTMDVYQKYLNPGASDRAILRFGRWTIVVMVLAAIGIALLTYTPDRSNNFILRISAQLSYFTPGIMAAFFFGVLWPGATARGAVAAMLLGPVFGLALEWGYPYSFGRIPAIVALFGGQLNFLHRIFLSFLLSSATILIWKDPAGKERSAAGYNALKINISGKKVAGLVAIFLGIQLGVIGLGYVFHCPARVLAPVGAVGAWGVFLPYLWRSKRRFWESDVFYAGVLSSASIWVYYYFA